MTLKHLCMKGIYILFLCAVTAVAGCGRQTSVKPENGTAPDENRQTQQIQPLPEKRNEVAGVEVISGGGTIREGMRTLASFTVKDGTFGYSRGRLISPDGCWIAFEATKEGRTQGLWVAALDGSAGRLLCRVGEKEHADGTLLIQMLGWTEDGRVVFTRQGTQPDGEHKGQRGISLRAASPGGGEAQEAGWLPVAHGTVRQVEFLPERDGVFVHVSGPGSLWRLDVNSGQRTLLADELPSYDGLFLPRLSPAGDCFLYELYEQDKKGIFRLGIDGSGEKGEERPFAPSGDSWNFYPRFSPDGRHVVYYAAPRKTGATGLNAGDYDLSPMEDGPAPVAAAAHLADSGGRVIASLTVPDAKLGNIAWAEDGRHLAYVAGRTGSDNNSEVVPGIPVMEDQSIWLADLRGKAGKVADVPEGGEIYIVKITADTVYYHVTNGDKSTLWAAREDIRPTEITPAGRWEFISPTPSLGDRFFLCRRTAGGKQDVYLVDGDDAGRITVDGSPKAELRTENKRLIYVAAQDGAQGERLVVSELAVE
ncbi:MAG: hypothetical protein AB1500_08965 [Bacillota bacterium]